MYGDCKRGQQNMERVKMSERIFYCKDCNHLDYLENGRCSKCGSDKVVATFRDFMFGFTAQYNISQTMYEQTYEQKL